MDMRTGLRRLLWAIAIIAIVVVVVVVVGLGVVYSGVYNVAADYPNRPSVDWLLSTTSDNSVKRHAAGIRVPSLDSPEMVRTGFRYYRGLCVGCHGGPDIPPADIVKNMNPDPPDLVESAGDWKPNELFWMTKHGIRMTGMPAWGRIYTDDQIWEIVAFVRRLPKMSKAEYEMLDRQIPPLAEK